MRLLIFTANFGNFDKRQENEEQELFGVIDRIDYWRCTESDFPLRDKALTPRLQARLVKMFAWQMKPDYDYYLWVDSSCRLPRADSAKWFMEQLDTKYAFGPCDVAVFEHPNRKTIQEEADYLKERLEIEKREPKRAYVLPRYENEDIDGILKEVDPTRKLFATTVLMYRNTSDVQAAMQEWWYTTSRYHSIDQLGFTEAVSPAREGLQVRDIPGKYMECPYLEYTR